MNISIKKRGQVTIFIILAVVLILGISLFFVFRSPTDQVGGGESEVHLFVQSCLEEVGTDSIIDVGRHGGYYNLPSKIIDRYGLNIPYFYLDGETLIPSKERIENQISLSVEQNLEGCIGNFSSFSETIDVGVASVETEIVRNSVRLNLNFPLTITRGDETSRIEDFSREIPIRLNRIHDISSLMVEETSKRNGAVCVTCSAELAFESDFDFELIPFNDSYIFFITEENLEINEPFEFIFATKNEA